MNLKDYYYYFKSAIPERICDDIVKYGNQIKSEKAWDIMKKTRLKIK